MAKMAEDMARVASGIAMGHKQRSELAMDIKAATRSRRSDVNSFLRSLKASRNKASRERMADANKMMRVRHNDVQAWLKAMKASRNKGDHERQKEARAIHSARRNEVKALLRQLSQERMARRKHFREGAAAFMKGLTSGVAALLDGFDKQNRDRAAALHERFAAYAADRHDATAIRHGSHARRGHASGHSAMMAAECPAAPPAPAGRPGEMHQAAQPMDVNTQSSKRPFMNLGPRGSKDPRKGESK